MLQTATAVYALPFSGGRDVPHHGYSKHSLAWKRVAENTSALAITVGLVLPALSATNAELDKHVNAGTDVSVEELVGIFTSSGREAAVLYADRLARVACQTGLACAIIESKSAYGNAAVYLWDLYPRLHHRYVGALLTRLRIPGWVGGLLGPRPTAQDVAFLQTPVSGMCAFEDCLRRDAVTLFADVVVDTARIAVRSGIEHKPEAVARQVALRVTVTLAGAAGAGVGRAAAGERGEYWGGIAGVMFGSAVAVQVWKVMRSVRVLRPRRSSRSSDAAKTHRPRHGSSHSSATAAAAPSTAPAA
ncbi:hypothetical protein NESM_000205000 [Novymonas esmeraldas]|uniref:Uncharacterized protein n=1 Tax=Novymonas esmeraldas TaxID=1808958 RepID=A0AAW0F961_9TRYP